MPKQTLAELQAENLQLRKTIESLQSKINDLQDHMDREGYRKRNGPYDTGEEEWQADCARRREERAALWGTENSFD